VDEVDAAAQHAAFRIVQEAVSNVYRHAKATKVSVSLTSQAGALTVRVADDGRGIPKDATANAGNASLGVGISGMRVRVEQLRGRLEIANGARSGTVVTAIIPATSRAEQSGANVR
jgi:signal transduction histidine kinase